MALKGLDYEYKAVHLINNGGEQHRPDYAVLNPSHEVPTLVHHTKSGSTHTIAQSVAIVDYLDQVAPNPRLFPSEPHRRALVFQACEIVNSGAQPIGNLRVLKQLEEKFGATEVQKEQWTQHWIRYGLETLETFLKPHAGKYSFGDQITAADCFVIPHLFGADRFKVSTAPYSTLLRIRDNALNLEAFKKASPLQQPDTPPA